MSEKEGALHKEACVHCRLEQVEGAGEGKEKQTYDCHYLLSSKFTAWSIISKELT
jgi:hypothetical protein